MTDTTALLVLDFQPAILAALPDTEGLISRVAAAVAGTRADGGTIAHVRVAFTEADWAAVPAANKAFTVLADRRLMRHDDPAADFHPRLAPEPGDLVVRKTRIGALSTTDLDRRLRERGITALVLAGVTTSGVVLSTALEAADRDYRLSVLAGGVADPDPRVHEVLMSEVLPRTAEIVDGVRDR
ncbi:cysteine hydrolase family protein [Phytomonospora endophytica]|uniref:Nicotinamidase-related amidase n=1 Tax=Phytomonospora endophytica TaxID=714109 RepID=A0A841FX91_9ACTN|nr:isochorismatase family cysteine hydrolase [Phytomonospora endophytica]MBB6039363.1 nicotinamidase-related amidase [Phytomonospora endophytica]GIG69695.1 cysteine hydrolase [Phytomonospora endophytica]